MPTLTITNPEVFDKKITSFSPANTRSVFDFDGTLTEPHENSWSVLRHVLGPEYAEKAQKLVEIFYQIDGNQALNPEKKKKQLEALWKAHANLLIRIGLTQDHITSDLASRIKGRKGTWETLGSLRQSDMPVTIFSGGFKPVIEHVIDRELGDEKGVQVVANTFGFCQAGKMTGLKGSIIHTYNKTEQILGQLPHTIRGKVKTLVFGDSPQDSQMVTGNPWDIITIGFLTTPRLHQEAGFHEIFDIVVKSDDCDGGVGKMLCERLGIMQ